jgi:hypothetical protein
VAGLLRDYFAGGVFDSSGDVCYVQEIIDAYAAGTIGESISPMAI